jgi:osmotically-inducible protein OsmY
VRSLIAQTPSLEGTNRVSVQTVNGVVYLRGLVSTPAQIEAAGALAGQVPGVTQVENLIVIDNAH